MNITSTPDSSMPSMAEASGASSDTDISRVLFPSRTSKEGYLTYKGLEIEMSSIAASDVSIAPGQGHAGNPVSPLHDDISSPTVSDVVEDEVNIQRSCHAGLNLSPRQLADVFALFNGSRPSSRASVDSGTDATTAVISNVGPPQPSVTPLDNETPVSDSSSPPTFKQVLQIDSLQRECSALKEIIRTDSASILKLKTNMDSLKANASSNILEMHRLRSELEQVKREKELLTERESQHLETVKILKQEVDKLTKMTETSSSQEIEQLRVENELFATQIIENEVEMREVRSVLEFLDSENTQMRKDLEAVQLRYQTGSLEEHKTNWTTKDIAGQLTELSLRLALVEEDRAKTGQTLENEIRRRDEQLAEIKQLIQQEYSSSEEPMSFMKEAELSVEPDGDGVEVTIGGINPRENGNAKTSGGRREGWSGFCDCCLSPRDTD